MPQQSCGIEGTVTARVLTPVHTTLLVFTSIASASHCRAIDAQWLSQPRIGHIAMQHDSEEYWRTVEHAYCGASFAGHVFDLLHEHPQYLLNGLFWEQLRDHEYTIQQELAPLLVGCATDAPAPTDEASRAKDYVDIIERLGESELLIATISFGNAALFRLCQLQAMTHGSVGHLYTRSIEIESEVIAAAEDSLNQCRDTRSGKLWSAPGKRSTLSMVDKASRKPSRHGTGCVSI